MNGKFRNSLFGFNRDDVSAFIAESSENEQKLRKKISELKSRLDTVELSYQSLSAVLDSLIRKNSSMESELKSYREREESLQKLSESIGRLYLVAQANAKTIIHSAKENAALSEELVSRNLSAAESAENTFSELNAALSEKTKAFLEETELLKQKLSELKISIAENTEKIADSESFLDSLSVNTESGIKQ